MENVTPKSPRGISTKGEDTLRLRRELATLQKKYGEKCAQLEAVQDETALLRRIQELLALQEKYQNHLQEQNNVIQTLRREKSTLEAQKDQLVHTVDESKKQMVHWQSQLQECQQQNSLLLQSAWQEAVQMMEDDYLVGQQRIQELEHRVAELQEQVLAQAKQKTEYETALQYLQEQSLHFQRYALQLSSALERLFEEHRELKKAEISFRVDLPAFLVKPRS